MTSENGSPTPNRFAMAGRLGGLAKGKTKARQMGREHYAKVSQGQRERWRKWREQNGKTVA
jgi:hypothetical protein